MTSIERDPGPTQHERSHEDALAEVRKVRDTAERMANGETPPEADHVRVIAGLIHQLAEQVERLLDPPAGGHDPTHMTTE